MKIVWCGLMSQCWHNYYKYSCSDLIYYSHSTVQLPNLPSPANFAIDVLHTRKTLQKYSYQTALTIIYCMQAPWYKIEFKRRHVICRKTIVRHVIHHVLRYYENSCGMSYVCVAQIFFSFSKWNMYEAVKIFCWENFHIAWRFFQ